MVNDQMVNGKMVNDPIVNGFMLKDTIQSLLTQVQSMSATNAEELEALRIKYLSKKGEITALFNEFRLVPADQKRELGQLLNQLRQEAEARLIELRDQISNQQCPSGPHPYAGSYCARYKTSAFAGTRGDRGYFLPYRFHDCSGTRGGGRQACLWNA